MSSNANTHTSLPPQTLLDTEQWKRLAGNWMREANQGRLNNIGSLTLTANAASTTVSDTRASADSFIGLMPTTANAAAALATTYIASQGKQTFTITHANNAQVDRTFTYCILG